LGGYSVETSITIKIFYFHKPILIPFDLGTVKKCIFVGCFRLFVSILKYFYFLTKWRKFVIFVKRKEVM
jgi:hypothetical protein